MAREIEAIRAIGEVLTNLDPASRMRVLRWASEHFELTPNAAARSAKPVQDVSDPMLSIDELTEFFPAATSPDEDDSIGDILAPVGNILAPVAEPQSPAPLGSLVHNFVADFQLLAAEWQIAFGPTEPDAPASV
jgi:hypothetical protein